jgi:hypothetical protein
MGTNNFREKESFMPAQAIFFRLLDEDDKASTLATAIAALVVEPTPDTSIISTNSFRQVPKTPFAYWVNEELRGIFTHLGPLANDKYEAKQGLATGDDFRFVRCFWEILSENIRNFIWRVFAKGGKFSLFYDDPHLLVLWEDNGIAIKSFVDERKRLLSRPQSTSFYLRPGLTWPRRTQLGLNVRVLPEGCIFADKGPSIFVDKDDSTSLLSLLALANSSSFKALISLQMAFGSYEVGVIQRTPIPDMSDVQSARLADLAHEAHDLKRDVDRDDEVTHPFIAPALVRLRNMETIVMIAGAIARTDMARDQRLVTIQHDIDALAYELYGISEADRHAIEISPANVASDEDTEAANSEDEDDEDETPSAGHNAGQLAADLISYAIGCVFGRWDMRIGLDLSLAPQLADVFAPLPVCAPGALVGHDGLPAQSGNIASEDWLRARPDAITLPEPGSVTNPIIPDTDYPLSLAWDGILVDDPNHERDIVRAIRRVFDLLFGKRSMPIEDEACNLLGVPDLRTYLRDPSRFYDSHIKRYSKSRRKAPIYWLLQSPKRGYGIWLYYPRLDSDLFSKALGLYLRSRLARDEGELTSLEEALTTASQGDKQRIRVQRDTQAKLVTDLREFEERLARATNLNLTPDLNDGVLLNIAPLWEVTPWRDAKAAWQAVLAGKYPWSAIGHQMATREQAR